MGGFLRGFEAFAVLLFPPALVCILLWGYVWWLSARRESRAVRAWAALSAALSFLGALAFVGWTSLEDLHDFPGYTCTVRDSPYPERIPADRVGDWAATTAWFGPNIEWSHSYEWFPVGVRCDYRTRDEPLIEVSTHSPWSYTVVVYALVAFGAVQAARVVRPFR